MDRITNFCITTIWYQLPFTSTSSLQKVIKRMEDEE